MCFYLTYKRHPGSGTNLTRSDVYAMTWERILWEWQKLHDVWETEAAAVNGKRGRSIEDMDDSGYEE